MSEGRWLLPPAWSPAGEDDRESTDGEPQCPGGPEGETVARFAEIRGNRVRSAGSVAAARGAVPIAWADGWRRPEETSRGGKPPPGPPSDRRWRSAVSCFSRACLLARRWSDPSCCPVSTRTGVIGKSSLVGSGFFQTARILPVPSGGFRGFRALGARGDLRPLAPKRPFPPGGGKAPSGLEPAGRLRAPSPGARFGGRRPGRSPACAGISTVEDGRGRRSPPAAGGEAHHHRPSRPSDTPCTTVLPAVLSDPMTGDPGPPEERAWPRSWLVGWARPWSQRPR